MDELREAVKRAIVAGVERRGGMKGTEVAADAGVLDALTETGDTVSLVGVLEDLVASGDLVEVEYVRPDMPDTVKSFFLPRGTIVRVTKALTG